MLGHTVNNTSPCSPPLHIEVALVSDTISIMTVWCMPHSPLELNKPETRTIFHFLTTYNIHTQPFTSSTTGNQKVIKFPSSVLSLLFLHYLGEAAAAVYTCVIYLYGCICTWGTTRHWSQLPKHSSRDKQFSWAGDEPLELLSQDHCEDQTHGDCRERGEIVDVSWGWGAGKRVDGGSWGWELELVRRWLEGGRKGDDGHTVRMARVERTGAIVG